ncbi:hypothetical protein AB0G04_07215 [Actinoplanes sp. NPDC023801]|uniref:hypothetical protein n=1 Tax=Actinoplanes sp. NPDC023801 TaxID=3154595 RepID=UPI0033CC388B
MGSTRLLAAGTVLAAALSGAAPAAAAPLADPPRTDMMFSAGTAEVKPGTMITLSGWAGWIGRDTGNAGKVDFFFSKGTTGPRVRIGSTEAASSGEFRFRVKATASGQYAAEYQHRKQPVKASGTAYLNVYTEKPVTQTVFGWNAFTMPCLPACTAVGPDQLISPAPIKVKLTRECLQPTAGGRVGFTGDAKNTFKSGDPGWRDFPEGEGPVEFELKPGVTRGHFYLEWTSTPAPKGGLTSCNLSLTATQTDLRKDYV